MNKIIFITGGARSGKSIFAERLAVEFYCKLNIANKIAYVATAVRTDPEFEERIKLHQERRGDDFITYEEPLEIGVQFEKIFNKHQIFILECLPTWLGNIYFTEKERKDKTIKADISNVLSLFSGKFDTSGNNQVEEIITDLKLGRIKKNNFFDVKESDKVLIVISNEVGMGLVPEDAVNREFRDDLGNINKRVSAVSDHSFLCVAGNILMLK